MPYLSIKDGDTTDKVVIRSDGRRFVRRGLTEKMQKFVNAYCGKANGVAADAVRLAGYNVKTPYSLYQTAHLLMHHPLVREAIDKRVAKKNDIISVKADYLINKLVQIIEDHDEGTGNKLRAIELAGKAIALWKERQEISGPDGDAIKLEQERKETVADFTRRIASLADRGAENNVVELAQRRGES